MKPSPDTSPTLFDNTGHSDEDDVTTHSYSPRSNTASTDDSPLQECGAIPEICDVAIIGAGPTGLTLACELARRGISFVIFDINSQPINQSRAVLLQSRTLEVFADLGLMYSAVKSGNIIRGMQVSVNNNPSFDLKFSSIDSPFPFSVVLEQSQTERLLVDRLAELGQKVLRPVAVWKVEVPITIKESFLADIAKTSAGRPEASMVFAAHGTMLYPSRADSGINTPLSRLPWGNSAVSDVGRGMNDSCVVHLKALNADGDPIDTPVSQVNCRYVVGCDGARSCVRTATETAFPVYGTASEFLIGDITAHWDRELSRDRLHLIQNASGVIIILPLSDRYWRVMCTRRATTATSDRADPVLRLQPPAETEFQHIIETLIPGAKVESINWTSAFSVSTRIADSFRKSYAILAGDAAHMHPPTFGQGMNTGIQDAYNLGWKLAAVIRGANPALLDTYAEERREAALEIGRLGCQVFDTLVRSGPAARCLLSALSPVISGIDYFARCFGRIISQTELRYTTSQLVCKSFLGKNGIPPGACIKDASLVALPMVGEAAPTVFENPLGLVHFLRGGHHTLLLIAHVLPPGTKAKTLFGCERNEEAIRWNILCLEKLARLARILTEAYKGRDTEVAWGGLGVIWVLCGLVNFKNPKNTVGLGQVKDHVPHRLTYYLLHGSKISGKQLIAVDYEGDVYAKLGLRLADPDGLQGTEKSGAFVLVRPDGYVSCNGYAGDAQATSTAFDFALSWFSD